MTRSSLFALLLLPLVLVMNPPEAQAQANQWEQVVIDQIDAANSYMADAGYVRFGDLDLRSVRAGADPAFTATLKAGTYQVIGVCDTDCSDLDLRLRVDGRIVDEDTGSDDVPMASITVNVTTDVEVQVVMYSCSTESCYSGVQIYQARGSEEG